MGHTHAQAEEANMSNINFTQVQIAEITTRATEAVMREVAASLPAIVAEVTKASADTGSSKGKGKGKGRKAKNPNALTGAEFKALQVRLRELKAQGLIPAGVSVRVALAEGLMDRDGEALCEHGLPEVEVCAEVKAERKGKKGKKGKKAKAERVVAQVEAEAPAKVRSRPVTADAPRRANGTITPKSEWALRESLAATGKFDRHEIDDAVEAVKALRA